MRVASPFLLSPEQGAEPIVHVCASPEFEGVTGTYWSGLTRPELTDAARDRDDAERLWTLSANLTGVDMPPT